MPENRYISKHSGEEIDNAVDIVKRGYDEREVTSFAASVDDACFNVQTGGNAPAADWHGKIVNVCGGEKYILNCYAWDGERSLYYCAFTNSNFSQRIYIGIEGLVENFEIAVPYGFTKLVINYRFIENDPVFSLKKVWLINPSLKYAGKKLVCLGDSITWGQIDGNGTKGTPWTDYMSELCGFSEIENNGTAGSSVSGGGPLSTRGYQPFWSRYQSMSDGADVVAVWGGVNDFYLSGAEFDEAAQSADVDTFNGALHVLCRGLIEKYPTAAIVFITPLKCNTDIHFVNDDDNPLMESFTANPQGYTLKDYSDMIKQVCDRYSIPVLDLYTSGCFTPYIASHKTLYTTDGLHPTNAGYKLIAARIAQFLNNEI